MNTFGFGFRTFVLAALVLILAGCSRETTTDTAQPTTTDATTRTECQAAGGYEFVCGPQSAEDLVLVPSTSFIIASGYGTGTPFYLIDARDRAWSELVPAIEESAADRPAGDACPGAPDLSTLVTHGLNLQPGENGHSTLYVVAHGGRESIEVFDIDATGGRPILSWKSCVMMPHGIEANSVASRPDGTLVFTVPLHSGKTISEAMTGAPTGALYTWSPEDGAINVIAGTELPYPNGVEVSADGKEIYVASSGAFTVSAFSNSNPARLLRTSAPMEIVPDNLHAAPNGMLLTAGLVVDDETCGLIGGTEVFDLAEFAACPRPFMVKAVDPVTMVHETIARGPADANFSNVTMALPVAQELWIGTFSGDRIAVWPAQAE